MRTKTTETRRVGEVAWTCILLVGAVAGLAATPVRGADPPQESDYYRILTLPIPEGIELEVGALEMLPAADSGGPPKLAVATRRGDIYLVDNALSDPPQPTFHRFAGGLHEVLGLAWRDGWLYVTQRGEVSRLKDENGDGRADLFETVSDGWGINGDYHEYAFGSPFDAEGNLWVALCLTGSFTSQNPYRGWCLRISPDGAMTPTCSGLRSPGGIGLNAAGDMFYTDNQGPWNGTCGLKHLAPGAFQGNPEGNRWYALPAAKAALGEPPETPRSGSRIIAEAARIPQLMPTAILFPYKKMGQSASGIACDLSGGKWGPFQEQLFVGDQTFSTVMRCDLEKIGGRYQGACFPFRAGFDSGTLALRMAPDGSMLVGGTNRGWGSRGGKPFNLQRLAWTGKTPFEILHMRLRADGFELQFTEPVAPESASDPASYDLQTYTYIYQSSYGSPEVDATRPKIVDIQVAADARSVRLKVDGLQQGHVHELHAAGLRSAAGLPLLHAEAYYTLNQFAEE